MSPASSAAGGQTMSPPLPPFNMSPQSINVHKKSVLSPSGDMHLNAHAQSGSGFLGSTLSWQYYAYGGAYTTSGTFVDNGGVGGTFIGSSITYFTISADNSSITFNYSVDNGTSPWSSSQLSLAPTIHNGIAIDIDSGPSVTSVTIDPSTNMAGFNASRISFTGSQIQVDWENLPFNPSTIVKLDLNSKPGIKLTLTPQPADDEYLITATPTMPVIQATAAVVNVTPDPTPNTTFTWTARLTINENGGNGVLVDYSNSIVQHSTTTGSGTYTLTFNNPGTAPFFRGGDLTTYSRSDHQRAGPHCDHTR